HRAGKETAAMVGGRAEDDFRVLPLLVRLAHLHGPADRDPRGPFGGAPVTRLSLARPRRAWPPLPEQVFHLEDVNGPRVGFGSPDAKSFAARRESQGLAAALDAGQCAPGPPGLGAPEDALAAPLAPLHDPPAGRREFAVRREGDRPHLACVPLQRPKFFSR